MTRDAELRLALLFTRGVSLGVWERMGTLSREVALYRALTERGFSIDFVTHGRGSDLTIGKRLGFPVGVHPNHWLPGRVYRALVPRLHGRVFRGADALKTNQILGGDIALAAARRHGLPLIARCGFLLSEFQIEECGANSPEARGALALEARLFGAADQIVVTTPQMREAIASRLPDLRAPIEVLPNYVDTDLFSPGEPARPTDLPRVLTVGRLSAQKNLGALIDAVEGLDVTLDIVGEGPERESLERQAAHNPRVRFLGALPHSELPEHLRTCTIYAQPALFEGHPKTLIEAMACGAPILTTDTPGIANLLRNGETARLVAPTPDAIRTGLEELLADPALRERLGSAARERAVAEFALETVADREAALIREVVARHRRACEV